MGSELILDTIDDFIKTVSEKGIHRIAFAEADEKRPIETGQGKLEVVPFRKLELLAYRGSTLYKCVLEGANHESVYEMLVRSGFDVTRRSRNIT